MSSKYNLLLVVDEVQIIADYGQSTDVAAREVKNTLNYIHNGRLGNPVMLLAGGLGTSESAFESLGISRFAKKCTVDLGPLSPEAERSVLNDWLIKEGQAKGNTSTWVEAIANETHGWPQHLLAYVDPALVQLQEDEGLMTEKGLRIVLEEGRVLREAYYEGRTRGFIPEQLSCLARAVAAADPDAGVSYTAIMAALGMHYKEEEAIRLFTQAVTKGVLARDGNRYSVPIPSMHSWLLAKYC